MHTHTNRFTARVLILGALIVLHAPGIHAAPLSPPAKTLPMTLANALQTSHPTNDIVIAVDAERVLLPEQTAPPQPQDTINTIAQSFGQETQTFGTVTVIAPKTRVVLNTHPGSPDIAGNLGAGMTLQMLIGSLDDTQWHALTSEKGLGLSDLTDETQKSLFYAQFPNRQLWAVYDDPGLRDQPGGQRADARDLSNRLEGVRIRLGQTAHLYLNDQAGKTIFFSGLETHDRNALRRWSPRRTPIGNRYGVSVKSVVPNTPKPSDVRFDAPHLQVQVRLQGVQTVRDLISRIARQSHLELYVDPHYAAKTLTVMASVPSASAGDLLQAVALSVAGTYRKVGPAYVLTEDLAGVGVRRKMIEDWQTMADAAAQHLHDLAGQRLITQRTMDACLLSGFGDPLALTSKQLQTLVQKSDNSSLPFDLDTPISYSELTSEQQAWAHRIASEYEAQRTAKTLPDYLAEFNPGAADLTKTVLLRAQYVVQFIVPFESGPVQGAKYPLALLFWPGEAALAEGVKPPVIPKTSSKALATLLRSRPHRALYGHPQTIAETDALIDAMQKIGLNELYLDVCPTGMALTHDDTDILNEALTVGPKAGIAVYAYLSLTNWGVTPPEDARDLTIRGETTRQSAIRQHTEDPDPKLADYDDENHVIPFTAPPTAVSFSSTLAHNTLPRLIKDLSERRGLAGFIWLDAEVDTDLGYTSDQRLSFLRTAHADPWDITPESYSQIDVTLPTFDQKDIDESLRGLWDQARTATHLSLLRDMRQAITTSHAALPILMQQTAVNTDWLASWDSMKQEPPPLREIPFASNNPKEPEITAAAKRQGRTVSLVMTTMHIKPDILALMLTEGLKNNAWNGYVLDFGVAETRGAHPLDALVQALSE